jgi:prepilin peptidase CpaA
MSGAVHYILSAALAALLLLAATGDLRSRIIPNWLTAAVALLAIPYWLLSGFELWPTIALHVLVAAGIFTAFAIAFHFGAMGGGDVKLVAALALWLDPVAALRMLVIMSLAGGALTLAMVIRHRLRGNPEVLQVPYGVAIAFAGFWLLSERYLNQFG